MTTFTPFSPASPIVFFRGETLYADKLNQALAERTAAISMGDTPPTDPWPGQLWFDSSNPQLYIWYVDPTSAQWVIATAYAGGLTSDAPSDGQTYGRQNGAWLNIATGGGYLPLTGATPMTGPLTLSGNATLPLHAVPLQQVATVPVTATGGTTSRTLADRFGQIIDIRDLGAACDGTTDDTAAWTAAFAKSDGTVIRVPQNCVTIVGNGFFQATSKAISIIGDGRSSVIRVATGTAFTHPLFSWGGGASNVRIENLTVDLNNNPQPAGLTLVFNFSSLSGVIFRNVGMINASANMYLTSFNFCSGITVEGCRFHVATANSAVQSKGVAFSSSLGVNNNGRVINNTLINTNINLTGGGNLYVAGNDISGWGVGGGIVTDTTQGFNILIGNKCHDSMTAIDMYGVLPCGIETWSVNTIIANNLCWNCCGAGISVGGVNTMVVGNTCWDNNTYTVGSSLGGAGIQVVLVAPYSASGSCFTGNDCYDSGVNRQGYGFLVNNDGITNLVLTSNRFSGSLGDVSRLSHATFLNNTDYVPRILAADPATALGAATKQYVDARGAANKLLYQTTTSVGNGADITVDVLQTFTVPANTLKNVGDRILIRAAGAFIGSTDSKTISMTWGGGASAFALVASTASGVAWSMDAVFLKTGTNTQTFSSRGFTNSTIVTTGSTTRAASDTAGIVINFTGQNATNPTANSITCSYFTVDYVAAA